MEQLTSFVPVPALVVAAGVLTLVLVAARLLGGPRPRRGEIWFAMVPFKDGRAAKDRPVLVLGRDGRKVVVARFTSQDRDRRRDHVRVPDGIPGLSRTSWIELRPRSLRRRAFRRRAGDPGAGLVRWFDDQVAASSRTSPRQDRAGR
ncbi:type II toxin-antitoxin system PemK/MazF family toxin [Cellulomonas fulva]|nr:type II toxin-antitoxin system PemK/MazF family toxin [Cellulomonas fulva]